ncbi:MAG: hypothetical protein ACKD6N_03430 [Candidatus Bathyarchaeota archaeon]
MSTDVNPAVEVFREIFRKIVYSSLGESAGEVLMFFLQKDLGRDPFNIFWENPEAFYYTIKKVFGVGAEVLINLLVGEINKGCGLNINQEHFLELICSGSQGCVEELHNFLKKVAELYRREGT